MTFEILKFGSGEVERWGREVEETSASYSSLVSLPEVTEVLGSCDFEECEIKQSLDDEELLEVGVVTLSVDLAKFSCDEA